MSALRGSGYCLLLAALGSTLCVGRVSAAGGEKADVGLVLVIAVDQLRRDRLSPDLPGGLGRIVREGRFFEESELAHGATSTCPGHVAMSSGRHPGVAGVPGNSWSDRERAEGVYCVQDEVPEGLVLGAPEDADPTDGRSPRQLRVDALGDWMKAADPGTRVFSVSDKDRAAITLGGRRPDAAFWVRPEAAAGFTTSRYYRDALPAWVEAWNGNGPDGWLRDVPDRWEHAAPPDDVGSAAPHARVDDQAGEADEFGRRSPHPLRDSDATQFARQVLRSPFMDELALDFAWTLVREEALGTRPEGPDMLAISLSATDRVGHLYGPFSHESRDALRRLDADLDRFLANLDGHVGRGRWLVALSSDHGVLPLPEWLEATGAATCPVPGSRVDARWMMLRLLWRLHREFGPLLSVPRQWVTFAGAQLSVNRPLARSRGADVGEVVRATQAYLEASPAVERAWTRREIVEGRSASAGLLRNSYDPERSGDLYIELAEGCYAGLGDVGTGHGSPHEYDRAVPLVFAGPGVVAGRAGGPAATVDLAPTLAGRIGVPLPEGLDGRDLLSESAARVEREPEQPLDDGPAEPRADGDRE